jgi:exonuclease SbcC
VHEEIAFNKSSTLLFGDIGSGKTTILLAVEFALFGLIRGDVSGSTLLRHGTKEGSVTLNMHIDGKEITIVRKLKRKNDTIAQDAGYMVIDGTKFDATPVELKCKILELCGYPEDLLTKNTSLLYRYTVYTPQEDMKAILFESKEERLDTLRKIFNIDKYKRIRENALNYAKSIRDMKKALEFRTQDLDAKKTTLDEKKKAYDSMNETLQTHTATQETIHALRKKTQDAWKKLEEKIKALNELKKDRDIAEINFKNIRQEKERLGKELNMCEYRIKEYENKIKDIGVMDSDEETLRKSLQDAEEKLQKINAAKEIIKQRLEIKEQEIHKTIIDDVAVLQSRFTIFTKKIETKNDREEMLEKIRSEMDAMAINMNTIKISRDHSEQIMLQLKDLSTCPVCFQQVDLSHKVKIEDKEHANIAASMRKLQEMEQKKTQHEKQIHELKSEIEDIRNAEIEMKEVSLKLSTIAEKQDQRNILMKEIEDLKSKKQKLDAMDVNKLLETISKNRKILGNIDLKKHIEESLKEKNMQKKELHLSMQKTEREETILMEKKRILDEEIFRSADTEKTAKTLIEEKERIERDLQEHEIKTITLKKEQEMIQKEITIITEDIVIKQQVKEKIAYLTELHYWINEHLINLAATIEKAIMGKIHREFDELIKKWFGLLMNGEEMDIRVDEEFTPIISQNHYETDIINLSGGEKTAVALSYRLALNKVINDFINSIKTKDIIILDEPTDGFSSEQLDRMRDVFDEMRMGQMIIVSHEAKMESYVHHIIRVMKQDHTSKIIV